MINLGKKYTIIQKKRSVLEILLKKSMMATAILKQDHTVFRVLLDRMGNMVQK